MPTVEKYAVRTVDTLLSTELNGLANNALALGSAYTNTAGAGSGGDGYILCDLELAFSFATAPTANTGLSLWLISAIDGTLYEDGDASTTPVRAAIVFPVRAVTTAQRFTRRDILLPAGLWKPLLKNDGTNQPLASSGNVLRIRPVTRQGV